MNEHAKQNAGYTLVAGLVLLLYSWYSSPVHWENEDFLNLTADVFSWTVQTSGVALILVSGLCYAGLRIGLILDAVVSSICGLVMLLTSLYWCKVNGIVLNNILFIVFGVVFCRAAWGSFCLFRATSSAEPQGKDTPPGRPQPEPEPEPVHPASIHPNALPGEDEPPPAEGYLAKLAEEEGEPPTASHE